MASMAIVLSAVAAAQVTVAQASASAATLLAIVVQAGLDGKAVQDLVWEIADKLDAQLETVAPNTDIVEQQRNTAVGAEVVEWLPRKEETALGLAVQLDLAAHDLAIVVIRPNIVAKLLSVAADFLDAAQACAAQPMAFVATP